MKRSKIEIVKREIKRLQDRIKELEIEDAQCKSGFYWCPKQTGAVRRASMDLTRSLSELRKY